MTAETPPQEPPPRPARPEVPFAATCLTMLVGLGLLTCLCGGGVLLAVGSSLERETEQLRERRVEESRTEERGSGAAALLDALAARLAAQAGAGNGLPEMLEEAPPRDPWGNPIEYERIAPERATLRSAGPDQQHRTRDDVTRDVVVPRIR